MDTAITNLPPQGRAFIHGSSDERARFISFTKHYIDLWLNEPGTTRTVADLTIRLGVGNDQVSRWMRGVAVPSRDSVRLLCGKSIFPATSIEALEERREWMTFEPFKPALNQGKKKSKKPAHHQPVLGAGAGAGELPADVVTSENASSVYDALAGDPSISTKNKMALAALIALASSGATIDIEVTARAR